MDIRIKTKEIWEIPWQYSGQVILLVVGGSNKEILCITSWIFLVNLKLLLKSLLIKHTYINKATFKK